MTECPIEHVAELGVERLAIGDRRVRPEIDVDHDLTVGVDLGEELGQGRGTTGELLTLGVRGEDLDATTVELVLRGNGTETPDLPAREVLQPADAVVPAGHHLEQCGSQCGVRRGEPSREQSLHRLRAVDQGLDVVGPIGRIGRRCEAGQVSLGLLDHPQPHRREEPCVVLPVDDLADEIVHRRILLPAGMGHVLEQRPAPVTASRRRVFETTFEQLQNRTDLGAHALVRPHDPRQRTVEVGAGVEAAHAELRQGPLETLGEGRGQTVGPRLDPAEVLEQIALGAVTHE